MKQRVTSLDRRGRMVVPVEFRRALGLKEGDAIIVRREGDELRILTRGEAIRRAQEIVGRHTGEGRSLVDELISERRTQATRE